MNRTKINITGTVMDMLLQMGEGNPGALSILSKLWQLPGPDALMSILDLDDMNMRGSQIYVAWKDYCGEDMEKFKDSIRNRDPEMVRVVNEARWPKESAPLAVVSGASFEHVA